MGPPCTSQNNVLPEQGFLITFLPPLKTAVALGLRSALTFCREHEHPCQGPGTTTGRPAKGAPKGCTRRWLWGPRGGTLSLGPFPRLPSASSWESWSQYLGQAPRSLEGLVSAGLALLVEVKYHQSGIDLPHGHLVGWGEEQGRERRGWCPEEMGTEKVQKTRGGGGGHQDCWTRSGRAPLAKGP